MVSCLALVPSANISNLGVSIVSSRAFVGAAKLGLAAVGVAFGLVAMGGVSLAEDPGKAAADSAALDKGRQIFTDYGCASCHTLGDAGATGHVGPALDGNPNVTEEFVTDRVTNGQGMMPSFASQLTADEIKTLAAYITKVAAK